MKKFGLTGLLALLLVYIGGCTFLPPIPSTDKIVSGKKIENPFFYIPPMNLKDYKDRSWILLAESNGNNWFYDPYTLSEDEDGVISFDAFIAPRSMPATLNRFNAAVTGPFLQKLDCLGNHQWSEIFYADKMPSQETYKNPQNPNLEYGWIKIRPKTAMTYIRSRICGRKFLDDKNVNYFLYQEGRMKLPGGGISQIATPTNPGAAMVAERMKSIPPVVMESGSTSSAPTTPVFYEIPNNEVFVIDAKKDIREIRISAYTLDKEFPKIADYVFKANCQSKTYSFTGPGKAAAIQELSGSPESLTSVAFDRACGDHGSYVKFVNQRGR